MSQSGDWKLAGSVDSGHVMRELTDISAERPLLGCVVCGPCLRGMCCHRPSTGSAQLREACCNLIFKCKRIFTANVHSLV